jgi:CubicO group peptidase (beta-lactamase class C family)
MKSAMIETDNSVDFVLSSYCWATGRDWTKFGMLYLNQGNWFGYQIFSSEWIDYSTTPAQASDGKYGAQIWLNQANEYSSVPRESYYVDGFGGQKILIIPSKNLVITVLSGQQHDLDFNLLLQRIIGCWMSKYKYHLLRLADKTFKLHLQVLLFFAPFQYRNNVFQAIAFGLQ